MHVSLVHLFTLWEIGIILGKITRDYLRSIFLISPWSHFSWCTTLPPTVYPPGHSLAFNLDCPFPSPTSPLGLSAGWTLVSWVPVLSLVWFVACLCGVSFLVASRGRWHIQNLVRLRWFSSCPHIPTILGGSAESRLLHPGTISLWSPHFWLLMSSDVIGFPGPGSSPAAPTLLSHVWLWPLMLVPEKKLFLKLTSIFFN